MSKIVKYRGFEIKIELDDSPFNPRTECDNLGTMVCFHKNYDLGDKHNYNKNNYNSWEELANEIQKEDIAVILPLYLYDHSGITMSTGSFSCKWDSGQVGFIYITKKEVREEYGVKRITKALTKRITEYLKNEVEIYDQYIKGEVYLFDIEEINGSIGGFFGYDHEKSGLLREAKAEIDAEIKFRITKRIEKLKQYIKAKVPFVYRNFTPITEMNLQEL